MDSDGLSPGKRAELLARLVELNRLLEEQEARVKTIREIGGDASVLEEQLQRRLEESRELYLSALKHLLGDAFPDDSGKACSSRLLPPAPPEVR